MDLILAASAAVLLVAKLALMQLLFEGNAATFQRAEYMFCHVERSRDISYC